MARITFTGLDEARDYFSRLTSGADAIERMSFRVGNSVTYARYVHEGTRRMRARPYLRHAAMQELPGLGKAFAVALPKGAEAVYDTGLKFAHRVQGSAQRGAPVKTGRLRRDIHTVSGRR